MSSSSWDEMLDTLSTLIASKNRADANTWRDAFENMGVYLQRLGMTEDIKKLKVIHVAGTKGKGSTCAMTEAMLRHCGYRTGLYTSPHLIDVRERVRIDGLMADKAVFEEQFWWCYRRFQAAATPEVGIPGYFRFMTLLALRIFLVQGVDVVVLEVGLGGRLDATNVVPNPVVCGITSLGMDHIEILGDTLPKIAREKAGILKPCCPGWTVEQPEDAMEVLQDCAAKAGTSLHVAGSLDKLRSATGSTPKLALGGDHMLVNAGLAVQLAAEFERRSQPDLDQGQPSAAAQRLALLDQGVLPEQYERGLAAVQWPGRSQVVEDAAVAGEPGQPQQQAGAGAQASSSGSGSRLSFFLDGAHTPESMAVCADWFAEQAVAAHPSSGSAWDVRRVLLFNCMKERDPALLLPLLSHGLAARGLRFHHALFVPLDSQHGFLPTSRAPGAAPQPPAQAAEPEPAPPAPLPDVSWQAYMQQVWEGQSLGQPGPKSPSRGTEPPAPSLPPLPMPSLSLPPAAPRTQDPCNGAVMPSLSSTLEWLRQYARSSPRLQVQVLVSGSLYLVGDTLRLLGKLPK